MDDLIAWLVCIILLAICLAALLAFWLCRRKSKLLPTISANSNIINNSNIGSNSSNNQATVNLTNQTTTVAEVIYDQPSNCVNIVPPTYATLMREENLHSDLLSSDSYTLTPTLSSSTCETESIDGLNDDLYMNHFLAQNRDPTLLPCNLRVSNASTFNESNFNSGQTSQQRNEELLSSL